MRQAQGLPKENLRTRWRDHLPHESHPLHPHHPAIHQEPTLSKFDQITTETKQKTVFKIYTIVPILE